MWQNRIIGALIGAVVVGVGSYVSLRVGTMTRGEVQAYVAAHAADRTAFAAYVSRHGVTEARFVKLADAVEANTKAVSKLVESGKETNRTIERLFREHGGTLTELKLAVEILKRTIDRK